MKQSRGHMVDLLFTLALFCVFAASALLVVILGANVYKNTASDMTENYSTRTSISYLAEKVRQNDVAGGVLIREVADGDALVFEQELESGVYQTWIFQSGGELREVMVRAGTPVKPTDGQPIMELRSLELRKSEDGMLVLYATDPDGNVSTLRMCLRCG